MYKQLTLYKIAFLNILMAILLLVLNSPFFCLLTQIGICLMNAVFLSVVLRNLRKFLKRNDGRLFIGRKRTIIAFSCTMYICITIFSLYYALDVRSFFITFLLSTVFISIVYLFADRLSAFLHKIFRKYQHIAIVGYDDNAHKLAEKLKRKSNSHFVTHLQHSNTSADLDYSEVLSGYIDFAKENKIREFYISVSGDEEKDIGISMLVEEAEKNCIRVNFIAPREDIESGFYHVSYIGGLPVLQRYREPLKRLHKQVLKRFFDLIISSFVIVFVLSWLIPLVSLLIKLESRGPVFFKQLRSGRDNNSFVCLKFRSMRANTLSDVIQATKNDTRITRVGAFLRKTSLDEFPQFLNVFMGDMSIVGPRPHMLLHTEQYSKQINHYMVRLYLKPGLTGWAQINGYRGEIKKIELMKERVEHDIWYMQNWSILLDIKIMFLTFKNILKGEENAY